MGSWIWKLAGTAAAVAAAGAAVAVADRLLRKQQDKIDAMLRDNPAEQPVAEPEAPAEPVQTQEPASQPEETEQVVYPVSVPDDGPNPNPVMAGPAETPLTEDGKIDVSKLCDPADFCDWDDLGCRS